MVESLWAITPTDKRLPETGWVSVREKARVRVASSTFTANASMVERQSWSLSGPAALEAH